MTPARPPLPGPATRSAALSTAAGVDGRRWPTRLAVYAALRARREPPPQPDRRQGRRRLRRRICSTRSRCATTSSAPLIDVGSGNGLPGIPLALATGARVVLLEPIKKRATFLRAALAALGLDGEALSARAPRTPRAIRPTASVPHRDRARRRRVRPTVAELTLPFLAIGGRALLQRGSLDERERNAVADAALVLGAELVEERPLDGERRLVVLEKRAPTGPRFPRKNGVPAKRPLCV